MKRTLLSCVALLAAAGVATAVSPQVLRTNSEVSAQQVSLSGKTQKAEIGQKLVGTVRLSSNASVNYYKGADGMIRKALKAYNRLPIAKVKSTTKFKAAGDLKISESFEGYDGRSYDWIPDGWTDESKVGSVAPGAGVGANPTWETVDASPTIGFTPYDGNYAARVQFAYQTDSEGNMISQDMQQDEWLATPAVAVAAGDKISFYLNYSPSWTRFNMEKYASTGQFVFDSWGKILELHASTDNGATWTKIWDVKEDAESYTQAELENDLFSTGHPWKGFMIDLKDYAGKSVKFAFRYVGLSGESMAIDNVAVGALSPVASYALPEGSFFAGLSPERYNLNNFTTYNAAYKPITWLNTSEFSNAQSWEYQDPENWPTEANPDAEFKLFAETKDLTATYSLAQFLQPTLSAKLDAQSADFTYPGVFQTGNIPAAAIDETTSTVFGATVADVYALTDKTNSGAGLTSVDVFGVGAGFDAAWDGVLGSTGNKVAGFAAVYDKPSHPYELSFLYLHGVAENMSLGDKEKGEDEDELIATVYPMDGNLINLDTPLASGSCKASDIVDAGGNMQVAVIYLQKKDGELVEDVNLTVTTGIYVEFTIKSAAGSFSPITVYYNNSYEGKSPVPLGNSIMRLEKNGESSFYPVDVFSLGQGGTLTPQGFLIQLGATYNWLYKTDAAASDWFTDESGAGGSAKFMIDTNIGDKLVVEGDGLYDWFDYEIGEYDAEAGAYPLTFNVQALAAGTAGRKSVVKVSGPAVDPIYFGIAQGNAAGVNEVANSANKVVVVAGNFQVTAANAGLVEVFNAAGQKVAEAQVDGTATIAADGLAKGLYLVKFADNSVVKVVK